MPGSRIVATTKRLTIWLLTEAEVRLLASLWADARVMCFIGGPRDFAEVGESFRDDLAAPPPPLLARMGRAVRRGGGADARAQTGRPRRWA